MPLAALVLPPALLAAGGLLSWGLNLFGRDPGRSVTAGAAWLAGLALVLAWFLEGRAPVEVATGSTLGVAPLQLRLDGLVFFFELLVLVPAAMLLTFQDRDARQAALAAA